MFHWITSIESDPLWTLNTTVVVGDCIYAFGRTSERNKSFIRVFKLDINTLQWSVVVTNKCDKVPYYVDDYTAVAYENNIYLWGAKDLRRPSTDLYCYNTLTNRWTMIAPTGSLPCARFRHTACVYSNRMYVYGGFRVDDGDFCTDLHYLDLKTYCWHHVQASGYPPGNQTNSVTSIVNHKMYIFADNRVSFLDLKKNHWMTIPTNVHLTGYVSNKMSFVHRNKIYVFCDNFRSLETNNTLYCFDPVKFVWQQFDLTGRSPNSQYGESCLTVGELMLMIGGQQRLPKAERNEGNSRGGYMHFLDLNPSNNWLENNQLREQYMTGNNSDLSILRTLIKQKFYALTKTQKKKLARGKPRVERCTQRKRYFNKIYHPIYSL